MRPGDKDASWIQDERSPGDSGSGYSGKRWGDTRSDAERARDSHNAPAGYQSPKHSAIQKHAKIQSQLNHDVKRIESSAKRNPIGSGAAAKVSSNANAKPARSAMAQENERRSNQASNASKVTGNASWVAGTKNAQEHADAVAAQEWMEAVTGKRFTNGDLWETAKSGVYLCTLLNKVKPGTVTGKIKESRMPFTCMELISKYIEGCKKLGIRDGNCFRPPDLYEKRVSYPKAIINNIHGLARVAEDIRGFRGPKLEVESIAGHSSW